MRVSVKTRPVVTNGGHVWQDERKDGSLKRELVTIDIEGLCIKIKDGLLDLPRKLGW